MIFTRSLLLQGETLWVFLGLWTLDLRPRLICSTYRMLPSQGGTLLWWLIDQTIMVMAHRCVSTINLTLLPPRLHLCPQLETVPLATITWPTYSNPRVRKELTPFQLQRKQMKSAFQFPNGENFTPRNQIARLPPSSTFPDSPSSSSLPLTQAGGSSSTDNDSIATGTNNRSPQQTKAADANQKSESESPKAICLNTR